MHELHAVTVVGLVREVLPIGNEAHIDVIVEEVRDVRRVAIGVAPNVVEELGALGVRAERRAKLVIERVLKNQSERSDT